MRADGSKLSLQQLLFTEGKRRLPSVELLTNMMR